MEDHDADLASYRYEDDCNLGNVVRWAFGELCLHGHVNGYDSTLDGDGC